MEKIEWEKPCGCRVTTNTEKASIEAAVNLGWKQPEKAKPTKKTEKK